jgi:AraC family transcriptional regulator of adaptative response/methylated-DNA-[protein]-cysteine methyltransferase
MDPGQRPPKLIERLRAEVERAPGGRLTDKELAAMSIDPSTARRQFKRHYGMTFQAYHRARRMGLALRTVRRSGRVDQARNGSGFESESGFRDAFARIFGETPTTARTRGCLFAERIETPLGAMLAIADDEGLRLLEFVDRRAMEHELSILRKRLRTNVVPGEHRHLDAARSQLADYFSGKNLEFNIPIAPVGSNFQLRAWKILRSIPVGETRSYSWMAERLGDSNARRAVGRANGENMICIVIPCHRVIRADGTLCGYGGGLWRKKWLLDHEQRWKGK